MSINEITLKPVRDLLEANFFIPSYQRGYRWTARLVEDLLSDLDDFFRSSNEGFYYLQPLVIKPKGKFPDDYFLERIKKERALVVIKPFLKKNVSYEVIDGQQRLTTLFILLKVLNVDEKIFSLSYETRPGSQKYLNKLDKSEAENNIDYYFIHEAKKSIIDWLDKNKPNKSERLKFYKNLLDRVHFIWYEVADEDDSIDVFTRLNLGKISLTNAELIKALFLNSSNFGKNGTEETIQLWQREIAYEWDTIEQTLQNEEFWYFLNNSKAESSDTRIDFIFDLVADQTESIVANNDQYKTFRYFYSKFHDANDQNIVFKNQWKEIKRCFLMLCEWYNDSELYHYVGFWLVDPKNKVIELKKEWEAVGNNKATFIEWLKAKIYNKLSRIWNSENNKQRGEEINKRTFSPVLLFHNIQTIINQNKQTNDQQIGYRLSPLNRFPFYLYKLENWDIEHVNSLTDNKLEKPEDQATWLKNVRWFVDEATQEEIDDFIGRSKNNVPSESKQSLHERFEALRSKCCLKTDNRWDEDEKNSLRNYVLLDSSTNRSYKNQIFPVKRKIIMAIDSGIPNEFTEKTVHRKFVPPCTKLVFMKYFSEKPDTADAINYWTKEDADWYLTDIKKCLDKIKPLEKETNNG